MKEAADAIRVALEGTDIENRVWVVGGALRDELLGRPFSGEVDLVTDLDVGECAKALFAAGASSVPVIYPRFGTAMVRVGQTNVEIVTARRESYESESRKPRVERATLAEDARRRDFTVNTLLRPLRGGEILDLLGCGLDDLRSRTLRTPLEPESTFRDDPLRMLRAVRFRWALGFDPAPGLYEAIRMACGRLRIVSGERIRDELVKMLALPEADRAMADLMDLGLFDAFAPELALMRGVEQGEYHHLDVWGHSLLVLRNAGSGDLGVSLAALLHDVGKPVTRRVEGSGRTRFLGHEVLGARKAGLLLERLRFPKAQITVVQKLIRNHMRLGGASEFTMSAARRLLRDMGADLEKFLKLVEADSKSRKPGLEKLDVKAVRRRLSEALAEATTEQLESPLTGAEIMEELGLAAGPAVGHWKRKLLEEVLDGRIPAGDRGAAITFLKERARDGR